MAEARTTLTIDEDVLRRGQDPRRPHRRWRRAWPRWSPRRSAGRPGTASNPPSRPVVAVRSVWRRGQPV